MVVSLVCFSLSALEREKLRTRGENGGDASGKLKWKKNIGLKKLVF
jgi:hypothetical protein